MMWFPILEKDIPSFLKKIGEEVSKSGMMYDEWYENHTERFAEIAKPYVESWSW